MKKNWLLILSIVLVVAAVFLMLTSGNRQPQATPFGSQQSTSQVPAQHTDHSASQPAQTIPAYFETAPAITSLGPTLDPNRFSGVTRDAYRAVREIPVTVAQLPCYCHCDRGFGHKSLYSCFEDDHASHCAVCVQEALLAHRLEREEKMTPAQIRETIVRQYSH